MSRIPTHLATAVPLLAIAWTPANAALDDPTCFAQQSKLLASDGSADDWFGYSVALSGDTALVGARFDQHGGPIPGSATVFVRSGAGWSEEAVLVASPGPIGEQFGISVCIEGDTALIGAMINGPPGGEAVGSVYVFVRYGTSWSQQARLDPSDPETLGFFGLSVALSGDTALIGSPGIDGAAGVNSGEAYVFVRQGTSWSQQARLLASDASTGDWFGASVSLHGDTAVVGANDDDDQGMDSGSAYVFVRNGVAWSQQAKLLGPGGAAGDQFGSTLSVWEDSVLVGAPFDDAADSSSGSATVFVRNGTSWSVEAQLIASDAEAIDLFGSAVALVGDTALIGAPRDDSPIFAAGSAYVFARSGGSWSEHAKLLSLDPAVQDEFGHAVALSGDRALIGTHRDDEAGTFAGAAYAFERLVPSGSIYCTCPAGPCGNSDPEAGCANSTGAGAELTALGATLPDQVNLIVQDARPRHFGIFLQGDDPSSMPFGDGALCLSGAVVRFPPLLVQVGPDGSASFGPCFGDAPISTSTGVVPGSGVTKRYQFWYRDPGGPCGSGFNASNGCEIAW